MLGVDTNVLIRFVTRDDARQFAMSEALVARSEPGELYVDPIVLVELNWTLLRVYRRSREEVLSVIGDLAHSREFRLGQRETVLAAISAAATASCDFSDALIALLHEGAGCEATVTFDKRAQRLPQMLPLDGRSE